MILNKKLRKLVKYFSELHLDIYRHSELHLGGIIHAISIARFSFKRFSMIFSHDIIESKWNGLISNTLLHKYLLILLQKTVTQDAIKEP